MRLEKDLHSVYIDGEMPKDFVPEYEKILSQSPESKADLEKMEKIHRIFQNDSKDADIEVTDEFVEESFARLQMKMKFKQNTKNSENKSFIKVMRMPLSFAAAAAVFALIFTPAFVRSSKVAPETEVKAISVAVADEIPSLAEKDVYSDGNINREKLSDFAVSSAVASAETKEVKPQEVLSTSFVQQKVVQASALVSNSNSFRNNMTSVDVFRPDLSTMKMTVPEFGDIPNLEN